jgi:hypothetical protein
LTLDLYVNFYENLTLLNSYLGGLGAIVRINNVSRLIDHGFDGIWLQSGQISNIAMRREFKSSLAKPYSNCDLSEGKATSFDSALYNLIVASPYDYSQSFCFRQCLQQLFMHQCKCRASFFVSVFGVTVRICTTLEENLCLYKAYFTVYLVNDYPTVTCLPQCPLECSSNSFTYSLSTTNLLGESYVADIKANKNLTSDFIMRSINAHEASRSVVKVNIFYESLSYTTTKESPQWDIVNLIATVGGNLGLFLGLSLFSMGEILITFFELTFFCIAKKKINGEMKQNF